MLVVGGGRQALAKPATSKFWLAEPAAGADLDANTYSYCDQAPPTAAPSGAPACAACGEAGVPPPCLVRALCRRRPMPAPMG